MGKKFEKYAKVAPKRAARLTRSQQRQQWDTAASRWKEARYNEEDAYFLARWANADVIPALQESKNDD